MTLMAQFFASHCIHILCNVILELFSKREYIPYHNKFILPSGIQWKGLCASSKPRHQETLSASIWFPDLRTFPELLLILCDRWQVHGTELSHLKFSPDEVPTWAQATSAKCLKHKKVNFIVICQNMLSSYTAKITNSIVLFTPNFKMRYRGLKKLSSCYIKVK